MSKQVQKRLALIELNLIQLLMAAAIASILAVTMIPAYRTYMIRAQVSEALSLMGGQQVAVVQYYDSHGAWPSNLEPKRTPGFVAPTAIQGNYVGSVAVHPDGRIEALFSNMAGAEIQGDHLTLSPITVAGTIRWVCGSSDLPAKYLPSSCRS